ncbi:hypothetical protein MCOR25_011132, partial [Pyricularia grisea]
FIPWKERVPWRTRVSILPFPPPPFRGSHPVVLPHWSVPSQGSGSGRKGGREA